jgi:hypothetical protein
MASSRRLGPTVGFYTSTVSSEYCELEWKRLGSVAVHPGRCCGLSPLVWSVVSVAYCIGRKPARFSWCIRMVGFVLIMLVGYGT